MKCGCILKSAGRCLLLSLAFIIASVAHSAPANADDRITSPAAPAFLASADDRDVRWFPDLSDRPDRRPPAVLNIASPDGPLPREQALIPLPAAGWTGLIGLGGLALFVGRKALLRFVS